MKVIINGCYGGFGISTKALLELIIRRAKCVNSFTPKEYLGKNWENLWKDESGKYIDLGDGFMGHPQGYNISKDDLLYDIDSFDNDNLRTDEDLISIIEEIKEEANGPHAKLKIIEIPDDVEWQLNDYDGVESIHEVHRVWS